MIGVSTLEDLRPVVAEFFELFKTPWEFARPDVEYPVVLFDNHVPPADCNAPLVLIFGALPIPGDELAGALPVERGAQLFHRLRVAQCDVPIYGEMVAFDDPPDPSGITEPVSGRSVVVRRRANQGSAIRIGYSLFA